MAINFVQKSNGKTTTPVPSAVPMDITAIINAAVADALAKAMAPSFVAAPKAQAVDPAMVAEIARLKAENAKLAAKPVAKPAPRPLTYRVSVKGAVSVYGNGRFPQTLYKEQMIRLLDAEKEIRAFMKANDSLLSVKGDD